MLALENSVLSWSKGWAEGRRDSVETKCSPLKSDFTRLHHFQCRNRILTAIGGTLRTAAILRQLISTIFS